MPVACLTLPVYDENTSPEGSDTPTHKSRPILPSQQTTDSAEAPGNSASVDEAQPSLEVCYWFLLLCVPCARTLFAKPDCHMPCRCAVWIIDALRQDHQRLRRHGETHLLWCMCLLASDRIQLERTLTASCSIPLSSNAMTVPHAFESSQELLRSPPFCGRVSST